MENANLEVRYQSWSAKYVSERKLFQYQPALTTCILWMCMCVCWELQNKNCFLFNMNIIDVSQPKTQLDKPLPKLNLNVNAKIII